MIVLTAKVTRIFTSEILIDFNVKNFKIEIFKSGPPVFTSFKNISYLLFFLYLIKIFEKSKILIFGPKIDFLSDVYVQLFENRHLKSQILKSCRITPGLCFHEL